MISYTVSSLGLDWGTEDWDGSCRQCGSVIETFKHIFEYEKVKNYFDDLSTHLVIQRVTGLRSLIGDHELW